MLGSSNNDIRKEKSPLSTDDSFLFNFDNDNWEENAEEMLQWSSNLDFDDYLDDWRGVATSNIAHGHKKPE